MSRSSDVRYGRRGGRIVSAGTDVPALHVEGRGDVTPGVPALHVEGRGDVTPVKYLARMAWRNADGLEEVRSIEALDLEQARTVTRQWATWARQRPTPLTDLVIVIAHQRDGCTVHTDDVPVYVHHDRAVPPAEDSIARARAMLAEAAARRSAELSGGFRP